MSQLSDVSIMEAMERGHITIEPWHDSLLQPASVDVTLGNSWLVPMELPSPVSVRLRDAAYVEVTADQYTLKPLSFVLATTREIVSLGNSIAANKLPLRYQTLAAIGVDRATPGLSDDRFRSASGSTDF